MNFGPVVQGLAAGLASCFGELLDRSLDLRYTIVSANGSANNSEDAMAHRITMTDVAREGRVLFDDRLSGREQQG